jgi:hypothetical protein
MTRIKLRKINKKGNISSEQKALIKQKILQLHRLTHQQDKLQRKQKIITLSKMKM